MVVHPELATCNYTLTASSAGRAFAPSSAMSSDRRQINSHPPCRSHRMTVVVVTTQGHRSSLRAAQRHTTVIQAMEFSLDPRHLPMPGTSPNHSMPEGLRRTLGSRPRVTARWMMACFCSLSSSISRRLARMKRRTMRSCDQGHGNLLLLIRRRVDRRHLLELIPVQTITVGHNASRVLVDLVHVRSGAEEIAVVAGLCSRKWARHDIGWAHEAIELAPRPPRPATCASCCRRCRPSGSFVLFPVAHQLLPLRVVQVTHTHASPQ